MTNLKMLEEYIEDKGLTKTALSAELGLSRYGLYKKMHNESEFLPSEIIKLCELLGIRSVKDREAIFFSQKVE